MEVMDSSDSLLDLLEPNLEKKPVEIKETHVVKKPITTNHLEKKSQLKELPTSKKRPTANQVTKERDNENDEEVESSRKKVKTSGNLKKKPIQRNPPPAANRVSEKEISRNSSNVRFIDLIIRKNILILL
jgi:small-conductance mechanosensitive channel